MYKKLRLSGFIVLVMLQLAVPGYMIMQHENVFTSGTLYKFETEPVDPIDPFRGRYVALRIKEAVYENKAKEKFARGESVYAVIKANKDGFAVIDRLQKTPPESGDYFIAKVRWEGSGSVTLSTPFERFYMNEAQAPAAEKAYRKAIAGRSQKKCWVAVKIKNGRTIIVDLYIDSIPVREYIRKDS
jgi:uncharacterized membrane-anchored protein